MFSGFKFYIHDIAKGYLLELFGPFVDLSVKELACCWDTAKSTLRNRTVVLDLTNVTSIDESARQWLAMMAQDGATIIPENFLITSLAGLNRTPSPAENAKPSIFVRLFRFTPKPAR